MIDLLCSVAKMAPARLKAEKEGQKCYSKTGKKQSMWETPQCVCVWVGGGVTNWDNRGMYEQGGGKKLSALNGQGNGDATNEVMNYEEVFQETPRRVQGIRRVCRTLG